jgi:two-component system KDP operon response regulator KdpE
LQSALDTLDAEVMSVASMRQLRLRARERDPILVVVELRELSVERLCGEIDLLRGTGVRAPVFVVSAGIFAGDKPMVIGEVADFATAQATSLEIATRLARVLWQLQERQSPVVPSGLGAGAASADLASVGITTGVVFDWRIKEVRFGGARISLSSAEMRVLEALANESGGILSTGALLRAAWGEERQRSESLVPVYIWNLRKKLRRLGVPFGIQTEIGSGYRLKTGLVTPVRNQRPRSGKSRQARST